MLLRVVYSVALGVCLGRVARTDDGAAVKQEVEDIFRTVERFMSQDVLPANPDSKTVEATVKEKIFVDNRDSGEQADVDRLPVSPRALPSLATFPIGVIMADNLYPLVVGKNVDSGKPFVMNLNKQHALVVARAATGGDYKLLIPFPLVVGGHTGLAVGNGESTSTPHRPMVQKPYLSAAPSKLHPYDTSEEVLSHPREYAHHQSYGQYSKDNPGPGEYHVEKRPTHTGKKYLKPRPYNVKPRPEKVFYPHVEKPGSIRGYNGGYSKQSVSHEIAPPVSNVPLKSVPLAYRQPPALNQYASPIPGYTYPSPPPENTHRHGLYPPVNYGGAYASVPKDFRPSPYLGNITEDPETGRQQPQSDHYESYDDRPYDFTEQDYIDSINSPGAHSSIGGVHHVTHHVDDYLGKIYEDMYYRMPLPSPGTSVIDRQGNQELPSASLDIKSRAYQVHGLNKTEASRPKAETADAQLMEVRRSRPSADNKTKTKNL